MRLEIDGVRPKQKAARGQVDPAAYSLPVEEVSGRPLVKNLLIGESWTLDSEPAALVSGERSHPNAEEQATA